MFIQEINNHQAYLSLTIITYFVNNYQVIFLYQNPTFSLQVNGKTIIII